MTPLDDVLNPPLLTADLPGIGGKIKFDPEDFEVEEIPAYEPSGQGEFVFAWIEKRDLGAEYFTRQMARRLGIAANEIGMAGLKDRRAVTRQWVSLPGSVEARLAQLDGDGIKVLRVSRHGNKLRPGHLHGNRFRILIRDCDTKDSREGEVPAEPKPVSGESQLQDAGSAGASPSQSRIDAILERIRQRGLPNFYGKQRFGRGGETLQLGLAMLRGEKRINKPFLKKLAISAAQSALFNHVLAQRMRDDLLWRVLPGDVMCKIPFGGMFVAEDIETEQRRFEAREIVSAGPIFGKKTFAAKAQAAEREQAALTGLGLLPASFAGFGKLALGTRRHNLVYVNDLTAASDPDGVRVSFTLPAGSYATILLREIMKTNSDLEDADAADSDEM